jgi:hypothetical protein
MRQILWLPKTIGSNPIPFAGLQNHITIKWIRIPLYTSMRNWIRHIIFNTDPHPYPATVLLIEVMRIYHHRPQTLQGSIVSVQGHPWLYSEPLQLLNFDFDSDMDTDPAVHSNAYPDPTSQNNADPDLQPRSFETVF